YLHRKLERPLLLGVQRTDAHHLLRDLLTFSAEYREHDRILPRLAGGRMLDRPLHTERREARWRSPLPLGVEPQAVIARGTDRRALQDGSLAVRTQARFPRRAHARRSHDALSFSTLSRGGGDVASSQPNETLPRIRAPPAKLRG